MVKYRLAKVCENKDIQHVADDPDDLSNDRYCDRCGGKLYQACPQCNALVRVRMKESEEGQRIYHCRNHCYHCGEAYPWKPSRFKRILQNLPANTGPSPSGPLLTESISEVLDEMKYGHEVSKHISDGDDCYRNSLWQPALGSYIHAFEWATITYLEAASDLDIIKEEQNGNYYSFAKGRNSLLDELQEHVTVDQKTISRLKSMNRAERRWMAHHKSGSTLPDEVDAVRARLREFLQTLFG